jgi:signal transduction histidine kinase/ActR/RegA family two-component response regulator
MSEVGFRPAAGEIAGLAQHRQAVDARQSISDVYDFFNSADHDFAAVLEDGHVVGLCGRSQIRSLLAGRYGFALRNRTAVRSCLLPSALLVGCSTPLRELLERALGREDEAFYDDVALVDERSGLLGLVSTHRLVQIQSDLIRSQFAQLDDQRRHLEATNRDLAESIEQRRQLDMQLVAREKASVVETLAGGIAHELNNKLMPVLGYAELLLEELDGSANREVETACRTIRGAVLDASKIIQQLVQLSRPAATDRSDCDLRDLVDESLALMGLRLRESNIAVVREWPQTPIFVSVDSGQIRQVMTNLVLNAMDAMRFSPQKRLGVRASVGMEGARLAVSDTGSGISDETLARIFDPFFTTKGPNRGTGLGLSVSRSIINAHSGRISVESAVGAGTTFTLTLPLVDRPPTISVDAESAVIARYEDARALVVEDDDAVADFVERMLRARLGCQVVRACEGHAACRHVADCDFDLILSDVRMPGMDGVAFLAWIAAYRPILQSRIMFLTGDESDTQTNQAIRESGAPLLRKPITVNDLIAHAVRILGVPSLRASG